MFYTQKASYNVMPILFCPVHWGGQIIHYLSLHHITWLEVGFYYMKQPQLIQSLFVYCVYYLANHWLFINSVQILLKVKCLKHNKRSKTERQQLSSALKYDDMMDIMILSVRCDSLSFFSLGVLKIPIPNKNHYPK